MLLLSVAVSMLTVLAAGTVLIPALRKIGVAQTVRDDGPKRHLTKSGTPTMGGIILVLGILVACFICGSGDIEFVFTAILVTLGYGVIGFIDDYIKVIKRRNLGLRAYQKLLAQIGLALVLSIYAYRSPMVGSALYVPVFHTMWDLGWMYIPFTVFVMIAVTNSVNLTDGLDGLASGISIIVTATMGIFINAIVAQSTQAGGDPNYIQNMKNLLVFSGAVTGACMGFLRFNHYPAQVFMGDVGSMALGGAIVIMAVLTRTMLILPVLCAMFMVSSVSDIIQVAVFKLKGRRVFKMAPLHHHFELSGMHEVRVVWMYMLLSLMFAIISLFIM